MSTQWHPLFARLLGLLIEDFYEIQTEVPVSDLPRTSDLLLLRRQAGPPPPFQGLWSRLTDWNVLEFKGPTDGPEEDDLELLVHVGTGITYRTNEERRLRNEPRLANRQVSFWYLAPRLGETFLEHARTRTHFEYETGGLWRGFVWGHPVWLLSYLDTPVEEDTIPLRLLDQQPAAPPALGELLVQHPELLQRFVTWLVALQPELWRSIQHMGNRGSGPHFDWARISQLEDISDAVKWIPTERVIQVVGVERAIESIGLSRVIEAVGLPRVIEAVGLPRVIETAGAEKVLEELLTRIPAEQIQELLRRRQNG